MKEVKLISKKSNPDDFGEGNLDFQILEGQTQELEDDNVIAQAVKKATIASLNPVSGYGVAVTEFRGTKDIIPFRVGIIARILRTVSVLSKIYHEEISIENFKITNEIIGSSFSITLKIKQGDVMVTV